MMSISNQPEPIASATTRLSFREGSLQRLTRHRYADGHVQEQWHDLFSTLGDSRKFSQLENLAMSVEHAEAKGLEAVQRVIEIDFRHARVWDRRRSSSFYQSHFVDGVEDNPIVEFGEPGRRILIDFASVVQFFIAPSRRCFEALVSPLGEMAVSCEADVTSTLIDLSWDAFHTLDESPNDSMERSFQPIAPNIIQCFAYWGRYPDRLARLRLWFARLAHGGELHLPPIELTFRTSCLGWDTPDGFLVSRLLRPHGAQWWDTGDSALFTLLRGRDTGWVYSLGRHAGRLDQFLPARRRLPIKIDSEMVSVLRDRLTPDEDIQSFEVLQEQ